MLLFQFSKVFIAWLYKSCLDPCKPSPESSLPFFYEPKVFFIPLLEFGYYDIVVICKGSRFLPLFFYKIDKPGVLAMPLET